MLKYIKLLLILPVICFFACGCDSSGGMEPKTLIENMKKTYSSMSSFHEISSCVTTDNSKKISSETETEIFYKKPNFVRIVTKGKKNSVAIVSDGSDMFIDVNDATEVNSRPAPETVSALYSRISASSAFPADSAANEFFLLDGRFPSDYLESSSVSPSMKNAGGSRCYELNLEFSTGVKQTLLVDSKTWLIMGDRIEIFDKNGKSAFVTDEHMKVSEPDFKPEPSVFEFDVTGKKILRPADLKKKVLSVNALRGRKMPSFKGSDADGTIFSSERLSGKPSLILFWDPLYKPSISSLSILSEVKRELGESANIVAIADASDSERKAALSSLGEKYPILDDNGGRISDAFSVTVLPHAVVVSSDGTVTEELAGARDKDEFLKALKSQMK